MDALGMRAAGFRDALPSHRHARSDKAYFTYESVATAPQTLAVDLTDRPAVTKLPSPEVPFDGSRVRYERVDYPSADLTRIPLQLFTRTDIGDPAFVYLYCYGAIGIPALPAWNTTFQMVLDLGGMVAIANVRGGGEFGLDWQQPPRLRIRSGR